MNNHKSNAIVSDIETTIVPERSKAYYIITFSSMLATVMQALDSTIANVALPDMQGSLSGTQDQMAWVLTSYIVAAAITIPLTGWLATMVGRKKIFLVSIAGFVITSIFCGVAETLGEMVLFRFLQGVSGAALVPLSQSILFSINRKENYGKAMALWGVGVTMGPILGPVLGGYLTEDYNWRWVFYINVPIGILAFIGLLLYLPESETRRSKFDFFGFLTLSIALGTLQILLDRGQLNDWFNSTEIIAEAIVSGLGFYLFIIHSLTVEQPFLNTSLFKDRNYTISTILMFIIGIAFFATLALLPPMLKEQLNYPVITIGLLTAPRGIGTLLSMLFVGRLVGKIDSRVLIITGLIIIVFSLYQMTEYSLLTNMRAIIIPGIVQGFGLGLAYIPLSAVAFSNLPSHLRDEGTSFFNLMRNLGSSIGISIVEALLTRNTQIVHATLATYIMPYNIENNIAYTANKVITTTSSGLAALNSMLTDQAIMIAYIDDYKFIMIVTLAVIPLVFLLRKIKNTTTESTGIE